MFPSVWCMRVCVITLKFCVVCASFCNSGPARSEDDVDAEACTHVAFTLFISLHPPTTVS